MPPSVAYTTRRKPFAEDVEYYLSQTPRQLPSRYLYDDLGSALFDAICRLPWYRITRAERDLLTRHASEILGSIDQLTTLVELGPGSGEKLARLLHGAPSIRPLTLHLVDISAAALDEAVRTLDAAIADITIVTHEATYEAGLVQAVRHRSDGRTLGLFLGSNLGNFDPPGADEFLRDVRASLSRGDALLLGADLVKPESELLLAYDDPLGVTAAFNRNLLVRANRELDADFDLATFDHRAIWNAGASRVEMHLVSSRRQRVRIPAANLDITFEPGETIWTESSYKYRPAQILDILARAGFRRVDQWLDHACGFALSLVEAI